MSANFEVTLFANKLAPLNKYSSLVRCIKSELILDEIIVIDNWEFENQRNLPVDMRNDTLSALIDSGKIIMAYGLINTAQRCGLIIHQETSQVYEIKLWISTNELPFLDNIINQDNVHIYTEIAEIISENLVNDMIICGVGVECAIPSHSNITDMVQASHNVFQWILPHGTDIRIDGFTEENIEDCHVWRRKLL